MIINERRLKFNRFLLPDEKLKCNKKVIGLKKGKAYSIITYVPDMVLIKNNKGINTWYKTKFFKQC